MSKVKNLQEYSIAFKGLSNDTHHFKYAIDKDFFSMIEGSMIEDGELTAELDLVKNEQMLKLNFFISGMVKTTCDVCLGEVNYTIEDCDETIIVKFGPTTEEIDETLFQCRPTWVYRLVVVTVGVIFFYVDVLFRNNVRDQILLQFL